MVLLLLSSPDLLFYLTEFIEFALRLCHVEQSESQISKLISDKLELSFVCTIG